jgi:DNA mismatch repair protein MutS
VVADRYTQQVSDLVRAGTLKALYAGQRAGYTRWTVAELRELGQRLSQREVLANQRAEALLRHSQARLLQCEADCREALNALWDLDLSCGVAHCASHLRLSVPTLLPNDLPLQLRAKALFHPVLRHLHRQVTCNDVELDKSQHSTLVVTGPNMGGKTTLLRSVALIAWLTQCGLPCAVCEGTSLSLFDVIHVRCGAQDDITRDRSTFFMEMQVNLSTTGRSHATQLALSPQQALQA